MKKRAYNFKDLTGLTFGRLKVIKIGKIHKKPSGQNTIYWECICTCGKVKNYVAGNLTNGHTTSCGCYQKELTRNRSVTHNQSNVGKVNPIYSIWIGIKSRCYNENNEAYKDYGGRGIKMSNDWFNSFEKFYSDIGERPSKTHSIDRRDVNGDYCVENFRWVTKKQQANNKRNNVVINFNNENKTITEWAEYLEVPISRIYQRIFKLKWSIQKALTTPAKRA